VAVRTCWSNSGIQDQAKSSVLCTWLSHSHLCIVLTSRHSHKQTINSAKWSPDGHIVATAGGNGQVQLFDIRTFRELDAMKGHTQEVNCKSGHYMSHERLICRYRMAPDPPFTVRNGRFSRYNQLLLPHQHRSLRTRRIPSRSTRRCSLLPLFPPTRASPLFGFKRFHISILGTCKTSRRSRDG
jgi:WD40 repeat protein